jgi:hypothetical protein
MELELRSLHESNLGKLNVLLAYENVAAALWAADLLSNLFRADKDIAGVTFSPRSFGMLSDPELVSMASARLIEADLIVISCTSESMELSESVEKWLEVLLNQDAGGIKPAVVALLRCNDEYDKLSSPRIQVLQRLAANAGCRFFAPFVTPEESEQTTGDALVHAEVSHA